MGMVGDGRRESDEDASVDAHMGEMRYMGRYMEIHGDTVACVVDTHPPVDVRRHFELLLLLLSLWLLL